MSTAQYIISGIVFLILISGLMAFSLLKNGKGW